MWRVFRSRFQPPCVTFTVNLKYCSRPWNNKKLPSTFILWKMRGCRGGYTQANNQQSLVGNSTLTCDECIGAQMVRWDTEKHVETSYGQGVKGWVCTTPTLHNHIFMYTTSRASPTRFGSFLFRDLARFGAFSFFLSFFDSFSFFGFWTNENMLLILDLRAASGVCGPVVWQALEGSVCTLKMKVPGVEGNQVKSQKKQTKKIGLVYM